MTEANGDGERRAVAFVDEALARHGRQSEAVLPLLQDVQTRYGWLPPAVLETLCVRSGLPPARIHGVATFYGAFRHRPAGRHRIRVCDGTACHVKGAPVVRDALRRILGLAGDADTDAAGEFTLETVACLGCCTLAPAVMVDTVTYGHLTAEGVGTVLADFRVRRDRAALEGRETRAAGGGAAARGEIRIGLGSCCVAKGSQAVREALAEAIAATGGGIALRRVGCVGMCHNAPLVEVRTAAGAVHTYVGLRAEDAADIVAAHFPPRRALARARAAGRRALDRVMAGPEPAPVVARRLDDNAPARAAFCVGQAHVATEGGGALDPLDDDAYRAAGGWTALERCRAGGAPAAVIDAIARSGLRGRGGAGFPTGRKWAAVRAAPGAPKTAIANGDEGDPGAFMDRMILESFPFRVIEGLAIAAWAVGASDAIFYIRSEYPLAVRRVREALDRCRDLRRLDGLALGGAPLTMRIFEGAGAFVCGEETALIASLEGQRGTPRTRPPYPAEHGFGGRPTLVNNVETLACVPWILREGPEAFARLGTAQSAGTKVFALAGKVRRGGLVEVPMGVTLRHLVEHIGGGVAGEGRRFKAVQVGGPSGGCLPASLADTPVDFEALQAAGAIMGSGGVVVLDDTDCMVELSRYFVSFTQDQSCGHCTFCRVGTRRMLDLLTDLCEGRGRPHHLDELEALGRVVKAGSLCGLGRTAPNPVLSTLRHFRAEYEAHVRGECPAGRCAALVSYRITERCIGCTRCAQHCPVEAIAARPYRQHEIDDTRCTRCGVCVGVCPSQAIEVGKRTP